MSTSILTKKHETLIVAGSHCENKMQNWIDKDLPISISTYENKPLELTQINNIENALEKNNNQNNFKKYLKKDFYNESVILQKINNSNRKRKVCSEKYQNHQNNFFKLNKKLRYINQSKIKKNACVSEIDEKTKSHLYAPQAPNNTTQFLITDREERESSEPDIICERNIISTPATTSYQLDLSLETSNLLNKKQFNNQTMMTKCSCDFSLSNLKKYNDDENTENPEFTAVYDNFNFERIKRMPRDEINQEFLLIQKNNFYLNEKVEFLNSENERLKYLLNKNGIKFDDHQSEINFIKFGLKLPYNNSSASSSSSQHESQISTGSYDESNLIYNNENTKNETLN